MLAAVPHEYVMQLALYRHVLARLYPGRTVSAAILWTDVPALMEIPADMLDFATERLAAAIPGAVDGPAPDDGLAA